jgi:hypothetical protein
VATSPSPLDATSLIADLEAARAEFHRAVDSLTDGSWSKASANQGWTNGQVLFHVTLAFMLLPYLVPLARFFGRIPPGFSRAFAYLLDLGTPLFNWVNGLAPTAGSSVFRREGLLRRYDGLHGYALKVLRALPPAELQRGMTYPRRWDSTFRGYLTLADVFHYPITHMKHHLGQIAQ